MGIELKDVIFNNCGIGVSVPKGASVKATGVTMTNMGHGFLERDEVPVQLDSIALQLGIDKAQLTNALKSLAGTPSESAPEKLRQSPLWGFIEKTGKTAEVLKSIIEVGKAASIFF